MQKLLIVDDEKSVRYSFRKLFSSAKYDIFEAGNAAQALEVFVAEKPDLVIVDIEMPGKSGLELLKEIKDIAPFIPVIIITAYGSGDRVIKAMKYGAYEYIEKPFEIPKLISLVEEALKTTQAISGDEGLTIRQMPPAANKGTSQEVDKIIGESPEIKEVYKLIGRVAASDASILVVGESGTGKELVAKAIHRYSDRSSKPFLAINCAAIPETLLESELFGYEKGAFTGADRTKQGKFEEADGGTLFLDEIGDMGLALQAKLLRVLQEGSFERLGGTKTIRVDVRIITATNRNLENDITRKSFREDLYYRIKVVTITLPPLRMRKDDIPVLARHFLLKHSRESRISNISLHPETLELMKEYRWPGNIRELENLVKRSLILAKGNIITPDLISKEFTAPPSAETGSKEIRLSQYLSGNIVKQTGDIYRLIIEEIEKDLISWAMDEKGGNQVQAAKLLGISRVMLHERLEKYQILK